MELPAYFCMEFLSITSYITFSKTHHFRETKSTYKVKSVNKLAHQMLPNSLISRHIAVLFFLTPTWDSVSNVTSLQCRYRLVESIPCLRRQKVGTAKEGSKQMAETNNEVHFFLKLSDKFSCSFFSFKSTSFQRIKCTWNIFRRFGTKSFCNSHFTLENQDTVFKH